MHNYIYLDVLAACTTIYLLKRCFVDNARYPPLPPGPKPKPIIGNLLDLPPQGEQEWVYWSRHKEIYGPISSISVFGQTIIIVNDVKIVVDILEQRSSVMSDRPILVFAGIMCGWENSLALLHYGQRFKQIRRNLHHTIGSNNAMTRFHAAIETEVHRFLYKTMQNPSDLSDNTRNLTGAIILSISHGYRIEHLRPDPLVLLGEEALHQFSLAAEAGKWLVDVIPFLRFLPEWLPGMGFKQTASTWAQVAAELVEKPYSFTKQQMARGVALPSLAKELLDRIEGSPTKEQEYIIKWSAAAVYGGGADTTVSATQSFFLLMLQHPEVQRKAQAEIDRVIGHKRLPTFGDRAKLPYVDALVKETLRYAKVVPMSLPHVASEDFTYNGYRIPKGAMVMANIWQLCHDPETYKDPRVFRPERFLGANPEPDPHNITFGFGRRICPGKELADHTLYLTIAMSLAVFDISWPMDDSGKPTVEEPIYTPGIITKPSEYHARITPRNANAEALINSVVFDHPFEQGDSDALEGLHWTKQVSPFPSWY